VLLSARTSVARTQQSSEVPKQQQVGERVGTDGAMEKNNNNNNNEANNSSDQHRFHHELAHPTVVPRSRSVGGPAPTPTVPTPSSDADSFTMSAGIAPLPSVEGVQPLLQSATKSRAKPMQGTRRLPKRKPVGARHAAGGGGGGVGGDGGDGGSVTNPPDHTPTPVVVFAAVGESDVDDVAGADRAEVARASARKTMRDPQKSNAGSLASAAAGMAAARAARVAAANAAAAASTETSDVPAPAEGDGAAAAVGGGLNERTPSSGGVTMTTSSSSSLSPKKGGVSQRGSQKRGSRKLPRPTNTDSSACIPLEEKWHQPEEKLAEAAAGTRVLSVFPAHGGTTAAVNINAFRRFRAR
jgi:hypothetical protein